MGRQSDSVAVAGVGFRDPWIAFGALRRMGAQAFPAGENGFTFGLLHGGEKARAEGTEKGFERTWKAVSRFGVDCKPR